MSCSLPSGPHIWPDARIAAGIDASMMTSLGTCRFVMPLLESTIASCGPRLVDGGEVRFDRGALGFRAAP